MYIGETGRLVKCRLREHRTDENDRSTFSIYARDLMENKHKFKNVTEKFEILREENRYRERNLREGLEILKQREKTSEKLKIKSNFESEVISNKILYKVKCEQKKRRGGANSKW